MGPLKRGVLLPASLVLAVVAVSTLGYWALGRGAWALADCLYMTLVTLSTVGYAEILPVRTVPGAQAFTMVLLVAGLGAVTWFVSSLTAFIVEGSLGELVGRRRMERRIARLSGHFVVVGIGSTGRHSASQFLRGGHQVVLVDRDEGRLRALLAEVGEDAPYTVGEGTAEKTLLAAGIERARGVVLAMSTDQDNLYAVLTARKLNPKLRIVSKASDVVAAEKLRLVGADSTVAPAEMGGVRLFAEMVRPQATGFLETLLLDHGRGVHVQEIVLAPGSVLLDRTLAQANLRVQVGDVLVLSVRPAGQADFLPAAPGLLLEAGATLIAMGERDALGRLRALAGSHSST